MRHRDNEEHIVSVRRSTARTVRATSEAPHDFPTVHDASTYQPGAATEAERDQKRQRGCEAAAGAYTEADVE